MQSCENLRDNFFLQHTLFGHTDIELALTEQIRLIIKHYLINGNRNVQLTQKYLYFRHKMLVHLYIYQYIKGLTF